MKNAEVVILAGGFGTRMAHLFPGIPKPLIPVCNTPILEHIINECTKFGFMEILLVLHFGEEKIRQYFGNGEKFGVKITYYTEEVPLGTGGALLAVKDLMAPRFLVLYSDVYCKVNLSKFMNFHIQSNGSVSILVHPNSHPHDSDLIVLGNDNRVIEISAHPHRDPQSMSNLVNAAMYVVDRDVLFNFDIKHSKFDIAQHLFPELLRMGTHIVGYQTVEYLKDMGTPERLLSVENDIKNQVCLARTDDVKRKAVFLDRDGTINKASGYISSPDDIELLDNAATAVGLLNKSPYLAVCITNQPVIARGECSFDGMRKIHCKLDYLLGMGGAYLDMLYFCPHHPDSGFKNEVEYLKLVCDCRKPNPGLFNLAGKELNISLTDSWIIGDRTADIASAKNFGGFSALVLSGDAGGDYKYHSRPNLVALDIYAAVNFILNYSARFYEFITGLTSQIGNKKYIFIGGCTRSGKSTFASLLKSILAQQSRVAHIVELDQFLLSDRKKDGPIIERYDLTQIKSVLRNFDIPSVNTYCDIGFDHIANKSINYGESMISKGDIVIVEGAIALQIIDLVDVPSINIFVDANKKDCQKRFAQKYQMRGLSSSEINELWYMQKKNEDSVLHQTVKGIDFVFNNKEN
jgi:histidinol-phosphate phosphatase family protein